MCLARAGQEARSVRSHFLVPVLQEVAKMIGELDHDGSGSIEFEEFAKMMTSRTKHTSQEELLNAFKVFDKERNGIIERDELEHVLKTIGLEVTPELVDEMMIVADPDGKGGVTYEDFQKLWDAGDNDDEDSVTDGQDAGGEAS